MEEAEITDLTTALTIARPTDIVEISVRDLTAPVQVATELTKLAVIEKLIFLDLMTHSQRDPETDQLIPHPEALAWARELRNILKDIRELTKGPQEKMLMKKMDIVGAMYTKLMKEKTPKEVIELIREMQDDNDTSAK